MPLPGAPRYAGDFPAVVDQARAEAQALVESGFDGLLVENFNDVPFYPERVPAETVAAMAVAVREVRAVVPVPVGVNVLRNDGAAALAIAVATGAAFVRVNVLMGAMGDLLATSYLAVRRSEWEAYSAMDEDAQFRSHFAKY